jgi:hypothetical protein
MVPIDACRHTRRNRADQIRPRARCTDRGDRLRAHVLHAEREQPQPERHDDERNPPGRLAVRFESGASVDERRGGGVEVAHGLADPEHEPTGRRAVLDPDGNRSKSARDRRVTARAGPVTPLLAELARERGSARSNPAHDEERDPDVEHHAEHQERCVPHLGWRPPNPSPSLPTDGSTACDRGVARTRAEATDGRRRLLRLDELVAQRAHVLAGAVRVDPWSAPLLSRTSLPSSPRLATSATTHSNPLAVPYACSEGIPTAGKRWTFPNASRRNAPTSRRRDRHGARGESRARRGCFSRARRPASRECAGRTMGSPKAHGGGGIRTHGTLARPTAFKAAPFDRSGTPPSA